MLDGRSLVFSWIGVRRPKGNRKDPIQQNIYELEAGNNACRSMEGELNPALSMVLA